MDIYIGISDGGKFWVKGRYIYIYIYMYLSDGGDGILPNNLVV